MKFLIYVDSANSLCTLGHPNETKHFTVIKSLSNTSLSETEAVGCLGHTFLAVYMGPREVGEPKH